MTYLVHPQDLVFNSHRINGFTKMVGDIDYILNLEKQLIKKYQPKYNIEFK